MMQAIHTEKIIEILEKRLKEMPGLEIVLNTYSQTRYKKSYLQLLVNQPKEAYKILVEVFGGDRSSANLILRYLLQPLIRDQRTLDKAIEQLEKGDPQLLKQLLLQH